MNRKSKINEIRQKLRSGGLSLGGWMQLPDPMVAEIMGDSGFDWVAVDLEHGSIDINQLPDIFRSLELNGTLPLARLSFADDAVACKRVLDAGAGGLILPLIENKEQIQRIKQFCSWPPAGKRGVGFSRANLFGKYFESYAEEAQCPFLIAMIESIAAVKNLESIIDSGGIDAILLGPYDLSASMGLTGDFESSEFIAAMHSIRSICRRTNMSCGIHVVQPDVEELKKRISEGFNFIAYSTDTLFLRFSALKGTSITKANRAGYIEK